MSVFHYFRDLTIRQKLVISYLIVIIVPMLFLGWYAYQSIKSNMEQQMLGSMETSMHQVATEIGYRLERQEKVIKPIVFHPSLNEAISDEADIATLARTMNDRIEPIITTNLYFNGDIKKMMIYAENLKKSYGNFISDASSIKKETWYEQTKRADGTHWWFNNNKLFVTRKINNTFTGQMIGIFYMELNDEKTILEVLNKLNADHFVMISDRDRPLFASEKRDDLLSYINGTIDNSKIFVNGEPYYALSENIPFTTWILHYYVPGSDIRLEAAKMINATAVVVLFCVLILTFILFLFQQTLLKGIYKLNKKMKLVGEGNMNVSIPIESKDEIGQLSLRFDQMLHKINQLIFDVYQAQIRRREAELHALQSQINPHFLYNAFSHINSHALLLDSQYISSIVTQLSNFYRTALNQGQNTISIRDEIVNIKAYIDILFKMHSGSFDVIYDLSDELFHYDMINLILQPIVENAIEHGIDQKRNGRGSLIVRGKVYEEEIVFTVEDNGPGFNPEKFEESVRGTNKGYGLKNVQERIELFFGPQYGISRERSGNEGTTIRINIPKYRREENIEN
ncbi:hypothetical protein PAE9249_03759 [Paenibacillus sp. CECT 9249]|uniref:sensor histidine kinase n=1 Tax=Paenibacillus sp. CECT 9249 TaxID=2845385 RepID=UPI001E48D698|nr:sensor histidine kinase [Paenibacillus sp. CECT 9249]CAH0121233.1 hypothetical protein PAE9249_03759 [Paenibacillus sp. CECT 9249]